MDNLANRQKRTGQWRLRAGYNAKSFKKSYNMDRLKTEPTCEDLMNKVDNKNRFAVAPERHKEAGKILPNLMLSKASKQSKA